MNNSAAKKEPSIMVGGFVLGGAMIGAGMFSLPTIMAGAWFINSVVILLVVCFFMFHSGIYILECISKYGAGTNYFFISKELLPRWACYIANMALIFVLYILIYTYISAAGSVIKEAAAIYGYNINLRLIFIIFTLILGASIWWSGVGASRLTSLFLFIKIILFILAFSGLFFIVKTDLLLTSPVEGGQTALLPFVFIIIPYAITSFGYHGNVCSLYKLYHENERKVVKSCVIGCVLALVLYFLWIMGTMGNLPRAEFLTIINKGGNLDAFIESLYAVLNSKNIATFLLWFSISAVFCSFLGVAIGLFDYILASLNFKDNPSGRMKSALLCFLPPLILCMLFPNGFLIAIAYAGMAACIWAIICPAVMALKVRERFPDSRFKVWGGKGLIYAVIAFGVVGIICQLLAQFNLLPIYR
ncbi:aromatic amino acid transporter [Providencia hangzhouensis]|uniref:Aromatic amino acid permease n=2 Tax=Providencia rettgeri TaxID=587 RepID=A0AAJ4THN4_PRORE|nr:MULTISPECIES: aromatic amino acid transporter [Providencia]MBJ9972083.1 tryptophan permease [Providencia rettgeri]QWQ16281.1 aromatic amino acid transporter [Providencia rettgeri]QWQ20115.1 aromatic amino acid transporter [Providencia rettgeri]QWQ23952.1 aromatic amino acid transporter [Providencia rettgeri]TNV03277.1 tryptophan permease [Providencia rettgeri]